MRIGLPVTLGRVTGNIQLGVPCYSIASLRPQLMSPAALEGLHRRIATASGPAKDPSQIELTAALSDSFLSPADVHGLAVGDIIATDHAIQQPLTVHVDGEPCYLARLGSHNEHKAICIESPANSE